MKSRSSLGFLMRLRLIQQPIGMNKSPVHFVVFSLTSLKRFLVEAYEDQGSCFSVLLGLILLSIAVSPLSPHVCLGSRFTLKKQTIASALSSDGLWIHPHHHAPFLLEYMLSSICLWTDGCQKQHSFCSFTSGHSHTYILSYQRFVQLAGPLYAMATQQ